LLKHDHAIHIQMEMEHRILRGLAAEWEHALWDLKPSYRKLMRKPFFSLRDLHNQLGYWSADKREMSISRNLVFNHPWDSVCEVLLHEIAHQLASEVLCVKNESPHGPVFQQACRLLNANPKASGKYPPLDERISHSSHGTDDKILVRVKKLMALAESRNRHEAEAAMAKAHELIAKYNIDLLDRNEKREFHSMYVGKPALRHTRDVYSLAALLQDFYFIQGIWVSTYVLEKGKMGRVLEISGTRQNIRLASYIHDFVRHYIDIQWGKYNHGKGLNQYRKIDFATGIIEGFKSKLEAQRKAEKTVSKSRFLMKVEDPLLGLYIKAKYPRLAKITPRASSWDEGVWKDGVRAGKKMVISKGISKKGKKEICLIENRKS
jgi:hypothetical protein